MRCSTSVIRDLASSDSRNLNSKFDDSFVATVGAERRSPTCRDIALSPSNFTEQVTIKLLLSIRRSHECQFGEMTLLLCIARLNTAKTGLDSYRSQ